MAEGRLRDDAVLVQRCRDGDSEALRGLYDRHGPGLLRFLERMLGDAGVAEDICQEAFLRIWRRAELFDPRRGTFSAWIYRAAANLAFNRLALRSSKETILEGAEDMRDVQSTGALQAASSHERQEVLHEALDTLKPQDRAILTLRHLEERSVAEIASILDIPEGTVKSRVHYALRRLRGQLEVRLGTTGGAC